MHDSYVPPVLPLTLWLRKPDGSETLFDVFDRSDLEDILPTALPERPREDEVVVACTAAGLHVIGIWDATGRVLIGRMGRPNFSIGGRALVPVSPDAPAGEDAPFLSPQDAALDARLPRIGGWSPLSLVISGLGVTAIIILAVVLAVPRLQTSADAKQAVAVRHEQPARPDLALTQKPAVSPAQKEEQTVAVQRPSPSVKSAGSAGLVITGSASAQAAIPAPAGLNPLVQAAPAEVAEPVPAVQSGLHLPSAGK